MLKVVTHIDYTLVGDGEDSEWSGGYVNPDGAEPTQLSIGFSTVVPVPAKAVGVLIVTPTYAANRSVNINNSDLVNAFGPLGFWGPVKFPSPGFVTSLTCGSGSVEIPEWWTFYWL